MEPIRWYINRAGHTNGTFIQASCNAIDIETQKLFAVDIRGKAIEIDYDYLLVAVGAEPATFGIPGI
jgi:NADH:ubiquinone reductase (non-electrogenic)